MKYTFVCSRCEDPKQALSNIMEQLDIPTETKLIAISEVGGLDDNGSFVVELGNNINSIFKLIDNCECDYQYYYDSYNVKLALYMGDKINTITFKRLRDDNKFDMVNKKVSNGENISAYVKSIVQEVCDTYVYYVNDNIL